MAITKSTTYTCSDGMKFNNEWKANEHEQKLNDAKFASMNGGLSDRAAKWLRTSYCGQKLREKHSLDEEGTWRIRGEDPNCDFGGHHYQPELGTVEGKLRDVVEHAVQLDGFYTWGGGGDIIKVTIKKV